MAGARSDRTLVLVLLAAVVAAGCTTSAPQQETAPEAEAAVARATPIALEGCTVIEALTSVPPAAVAPHLPPGFAPYDDGTGATAILGGADCETGGARAFFAIQVEPTDDALRGDGVDRYYWEPEHYVVAEDEFGRAVALLGATTTPAEIALEHAATGASLRASVPGGDHGIDLPLGAVGPGPSRIAAGVFREYFPAEGGYGYLEAEFALEPTTPFAVYVGTVRTAEGTPARDVLGAERRSPAGVADMGFADAVVGFVPYPPPSGT